MRWMVIAGPLQLHMIPHAYGLIANSATALLPHGDPHLGLKRSSEQVQFLVSQKSGRIPGRRIPVEPTHMHERQTLVGLAHQH